MTQYLRLEINGIIEMSARHYAEEYQRIVDFAMPIIKKYDELTQPLAFWVFDIKGVEDAIALWKKAMPHIRPHFAMKSNPEPHLVELLGNLGCGFDCASLGEIKEVLKLGFSPADITYSHCFKPYDQLLKAYELGVRLTTVDCIDEVQKVKKYAPEMGVMVRILQNDGTTDFSYGKRFGLKPEEVEEVVAEIAKQELKMRGVHFHIRFDSHNEKTIIETLKSARDVVTIAQKYGLKPDLFDIGGGHMQNEDFEKFGKLFEDTITSLKFPDGSHFIAEPGRFLSSNAFHLVTSLHGKKVKKVNGEKMIDYTIGDGVHGCLAFCFMFKKELPCFSPTCKNPNKVNSIIYGTTCNGADRVSSGLFPEMQPGVDWLIFPSTGAYSITLATNFNGFNFRQHDVYVMPNKDVKKIEVPLKIEKHSVHSLVSGVSHWIKNEN
ncbi:ornithine decarboxylase, putative [Entamoeba invadens IP1]|uniref:ornithine decarboxylase n=1 Tax=Entamoeba invadens IP1 TaxID=370355 RepID=A0A0A1U8X6_ENTIV|nr:ornithine decarboxylase, putative [Entamoeba invadens IP1]ELP91354.1 ornithine decarboxylase, putative [Entamoeba invadens IP1]|eukprot:XP_004258125.1 ornithine decarboxylase, putative [Entamoeba invadens IP1]